MNIAIDVPTLIQISKQRSGKNLGALAAEMHVHAARLSEWQKGVREPSTDQLAFLAGEAGLPILETIAALKPEWAHVWKRAADQVQKLYFSTLHRFRVR